MYRGGGYTAEVKKYGRERYLLNVRDHKGRMVKRRWYDNRFTAMDVLWMYILEQDVV